jgi:O-antigen biosynthesis protein
MIGGLFGRRTPYARGNRARDGRDYGSAARHYHRHLATHPDDAAIWIQLGHMLSETRDYAGADAAYAQAAALTPHDADLMRCWGHSRARAGDEDRARHLYAAADALEGNAPPAIAEQPASVEEAAAEPAPPPPAAPRRAWEARLQVVKTLPVDGREVALFVTHSATGAIKPHVRTYAAALEAQGIAVLLIAVADRELSIRPELLDTVSGAVVRDNAGYDFAAWAHILHLHPELYAAPTLYLVNDSLFGPAAGDAFADMLARVRASDADLIGLTESHEYRWHVQSYFLALKPRLLGTMRLHHFLGDVRIHDDKDAVIRGYEVRFAEEMEGAGARIEILFPSPAPLNPTLHGWRGLIVDGFPFVKLLPLRGHFPEVDLTGWRELLADAGFDMAMLDATIAASEISVPRDDSGRLYAHPLHWDGAKDRPLKVAFYGPWNYDNGLGVASRAIVAALRKTGVQLNLHPVKKTFHVHRPLTPPVDVIEFGGPADVAIVHLNPDCWFILTDEQRAEVNRAHRRIGYWVWEMGHLPDGWRDDFSSVDRIWTPSHYCAELFAAEDEAPVDVIPHPVAVPAPATVDRPAALARHGLAADARVIFYLFDGSSYLVRKNPAALVRAFSASALAAQGWALVLKTKHLMDRPDEGVAFRDLVQSTPGALLIDRTLDEAELADLLTLADIYASPHCSEGFGLTIAEAMAAGKAVVATDFGGSRDFLDAATGYPVKARPWTLDRDYGHYRAGGTWGRIDEPALAAALLQAADAITGGDTARQAAARDRIATMLSTDAVAAAISASFAALTEGGGHQPPVDRFTPHLDRGSPVSPGHWGEAVNVVPLRADGSVDPEQDWGQVPDRDWLAFAPAGAVLAPDFARIVRAHADARPDASLLYADDVAADAPMVDRLRLKPEFDATLAAAQDYVGAPVVIRVSALRQLSGLDESAGTAAMLDLLLRADAAGLSIARIPQVLLGHPGKRVRAKPADHRAVLACLPRFAEHDVVDGLTADTLALARRLPDPPPLTIVIPTRRTPLPDGSGSYVERLLARIAEAYWPMDRLTVIVGDDVEGEPGAATYPFALRRIATPRPADAPFNYAAKMNRLWRAAETELVVLLNDDVDPHGDDWLGALVGFALDPKVGGVGARLLYPDGTIQHAGFGPHHDGLAHLWIHRRRQEGTYQSWALTQREWSMVTGAVFATRRNVLEEVGGFDERFALEYNDTDLCFRLRLAGYRIVYEPRACFTHVEKASRGETLPPGENSARFFAKWRGWIDADPSWHPGYRRDRTDLQPRIDRDAWYA